MAARNGLAGSEGNVVMRAAFLRSEESLRRPRPSRAVAVTAPAPADYAPARYHRESRPNWWVIGGLVVGHAAIFSALLTTGAVTIGPEAKPPIVVELIPLPPAPPPPPSAPEPRPVQEIVRPVAPVVPPPIVQVAAPTPPPIQTVTKAPPPEPAPVAVAKADSPAVAPSLPSTPLNAMPGNPPLKYPLEARRKHQQGAVRLRVVIDTDGRVAEISVAKSSGYESIDQAALSVTRKWRFQPQIDGGRPVMAVGYITQTFALG